MLKQNTPLITGLIALGWMGLGNATPVEPSGACPTLTRTNTYNGSAIDLTATGTTGSPTWQTTPPSSMTSMGQIQTPLTSAQSINCISLPSGFQVQLWADETDTGHIAAIQDFSFDESGRMWAVETFDYPNNVTGSGTPPDPFHGNDRIVIMSDANGSGVVNTWKQFVGGLNIPQGIQVVNGGVVVDLSPYLVYYSDANIPDTADIQTGQPLFAGFPRSAAGYDTHATHSNPHYNIDNWIYGIEGSDSATVTAAPNTGNVVLDQNGNAVASTSSGQGVFRFRKKGNSWQFQYVGSTTSNSHGIGLMEDGQIFASSADTGHSLHVLWPGLPTVKIAAANGGTTVQQVWPVTVDIHRWDNGSNFTAATGHDFYTSRLFPQKYWSRFAFVNEGESHVVNMDSLVPNKSTWSAVRLARANSNVFASTDAWTAPIVSKVGPDGALWVLDWNDYLFLHNPATPVGLGNAWDSPSILPLRTKTTERIYRILPSSGALEPVLNLKNAPVSQLVSTFYNPNYFWRLTAQRLLIGMGFTSEMGDSLQNIMTNHRTVDAVGNDPSVMHAVWTLNGLGRFDSTSDTARWNPILKSLLLHPAKGVRENVLKAMPLTTASAEAIKAQCTANDSDPQVRLQAFLALAAMPAAPSGPVPVLSTYTTIAGTDTYANQAFAKANTGNRVMTVTTAPTGCPTLAATTRVFPAYSNYRALPKDDFHYTVIGRTLELQPNRQLGSGELIVYDLRGKIVFRSVFTASQNRWSESTLTGLNMSAYFYSFRGINGNQFNGRIIMTPEF